MKIALAQINCTAADLRGNLQKIQQALQRAEQAGATLLLTPQMSLCGLTAADWLLRNDFLQTCQQVFDELVAQVQETALIIGHPEQKAGRLFNALSVIQHGRVQATCHQQHFSADPLQDAQRYFAVGTQVCVFELAGKRFGLTTYADFQHATHLQALHSAGAQLVLVADSAPFVIDGQVQRRQQLSQGAVEAGLPVIYVNLIGGQDEQVFDGASCALDSTGKLTHQLPAFQDIFALIELCDQQFVAGLCSTLPEPIEGIYTALCLGLRDFIDKNRFPGVLIGLSGGVDSALVLTIAVDALGAERVRTVMMPSPYTADISLQDAQALADNLGVQQHTMIPVSELLDTFQRVLQVPLAAYPEPEGSTVAENLQARIRGTLLMALANQSGLLVLPTSNKSETAVGYSTLYGDMVGGLAILKDVSKTRVYQLCHYRNQIASVIPERILQRPPSAELRPDQTDQDSLPSYAILDPIISAYVENNQSVAEIIAAGYQTDVVERIVGLIRSCEYKRGQAAPGIRITQRDFGRTWRFPLTAGFKY